MKRDFPSLLPAQLLAQEITVTLPLADILQLYTPAVTSFEASTDAGSIPIGAEAAGQIYAGLTLHDNRPCRLFLVPGELASGETWVGIVLARGKPSHHLVLLAGETTATWKDAQAWAKKQGGELPTRKEQALLFANAADAFEREWYWSSEKHAHDADYAWVQRFDYGGQYYGHTSDRYRARAVRRVAI